MGLPYLLIKSSSLRFLCFHSNHSASVPVHYVQISVCVLLMTEITMQLQMYWTFPFLEHLYVEWTFELDLLITTSSMIAPPCFGTQNTERTRYIYSCRLLNVHSLSFPLNETFIFSSGPQSSFASFTWTLSNSFLSLPSSLSKLVSNANISFQLKSLSLTLHWCGLFQKGVKTI